MNVSDNPLNEIVGFPHVRAVWRVMMHWSVSKRGGPVMFGFTGSGVTAKPAKHGSRHGAARQAKRGRVPDRLLAAAVDYAEIGWAPVRGAHPLHDGTRACSCDRVGCPAPGAHPQSPVWQRQATADPTTIRRWWTEQPDANIILPTARVFDVLDVPATAGELAMPRLRGCDATAGPVATGDGRYLFFVATRGAPDDEDEWWSSRLDCVPDTSTEMPGLRWHCRNSYVLAPPSVLPGGTEVTWIVPPNDTPDLLPDPVRILEVLADAVP
jgi:hypothetical protein